MTVPLSSGVEDCTEFPSLLLNVLLKVVRDIINDVCCHSVMKNVVSNKKFVQMLFFALQKKI